MQTEGNVKIDSSAWMAVRLAGDEGISATGFDEGMCLASRSTPS